MKRTVGVMTVAVMLCAQTGTYAADQMSKERNGGQPSGQPGQNMQRPSGQAGQSAGQSGQSAQDMQRQSGQSGNFSEEMQRQNSQIWQSGQQAKALCQKPAPVKQASAQPAPPAGDQPKQQAQAGQQSTPDQSKQQAQAGQQSTPDQSKQQAQAGQPTPEQGKQQGQAGRELDKQSAQEQSRASGATQTIKGQFVRMEGDFYVVKDQSGKEACIPTSYGTFVDQTFSPGDNIVARLGQDGNALLIGRPSDRQTASSSSPDQGMSQAAGDQRGDKGFSGSPQGSQPQDSATRDQSTKSADKGLSGSQQTASTVKGELLKIEGEFYTVKDQSGSEVRLHVNKDTKMESAVSVGDKIEAERTSADHAISMKKAQDAGGSQNR